MNDPISIYTIGHSNLLAHELVRLLGKFNIQVVADVRSSPYSQYSPQFNRENFQKTLVEAGLSYRFFGDSLGGRPKDAACYKNGKIPDGKADYLNLVDYPAVMTKTWFQDGLIKLLEVADKKKVVTMCSEEDPARCHRHHLIGKALVAKNIEVLHIRKDGNLVRDQLLPDLSTDSPAEQLTLFD